MLLSTVVKAKIGAGRVKSALVNRYVVNAKGVNLLEYALLALLAVGLFAGVSILFREQISTLLKNITSSISGSTDGDLTGK